MTYYATIGKKTNEIACVDVSEENSLDTMQAITTAKNHYYRCIVPVQTYIDWSNGHDIKANYVYHSPSVFDRTFDIIERRKGR